MIGNQHLMISCCICFLSGCWMGDRFPYTEYGDVTIGKDQLCINDNKGDALEFYALYSSENIKENPLLSSYENPITMRYPDVCINTALNNGYTYTLVYKISKMTYQFEFHKDMNGIVTITRGR